MNSLQQFKDWCQDRKNKFLRLFEREKQRPYGPCLTPENVPRFYIPDSSEALLGANASELKLEDELQQHYPLPFNAHKSPRSAHQGNTFVKLKEDQFKACKFSREDDERKKDLPSGRNNKTSDDYFDHFGPILPKVENIPSVYFGNLDPGDRSFFKRRGTDSKKDQRRCGMRMRLNTEEEDPLPLRSDSKRSPLCYRRRSSLPNLVAPTDLETKTSETGPSSTMNSSPRPKVLRRVASVDDCTVKLHTSVQYKPNVSNTNGYPSAATISKTLKAKTQGIPSRSPRTHLGEIKFEFTYLPAKKCLSVFLIRGENVGGFTRPDYNMNTYIKLCLLPGNDQTQLSDEKKHTKDPHFDEEFLFHKLSLKDLQLMSLRMKIYNNIPLVPNECLGEINIALGKYDLMQKTRVWRNIEPKVPLRKDLGHIFVSLNLNVEEKQMNVTIGRATGLRYLPITGAPNAYVSVEVSQEFGNFVKRRTKTKKKTTFPVFKESLTFDLASVTQENLELTCVVVTLMSSERIRSDTVLGEVRLGYDSTEDSEVLHWQEVKRFPGQDVGKWHYLMECGEVFN